MKSLGAIIISALSFVIVPVLSQSGSRETGEKDCGVVRQALHDYGQIKVGTTRADLTKDFIPEGGMQFPTQTRYIYARCQYLHIEVDFELAKPSSIGFSPEDKITHVSKLYVEYPAKD